MHAVTVVSDLQMFDIDHSTTASVQTSLARGNGRTFVTLILTSSNSLEFIGRGEFYRLKIVSPESHTLLSK